MNNEEDMHLDIMTPRTSDKKLDYKTYLAVVNALKVAGGDGLLHGLQLPQYAADMFPGSQIRMARIILRVRGAGTAGRIPDDTDVYVYTAIEVRWDSSTLSFVDSEGGIEWNGVDENFIRLVGQPGFGEKIYESGPLLNGAIVPVYEVSENAAYPSSGNDVAGYQLFERAYYIIYAGDDPVVHPFKCRVNADDPMMVDVGYMRDFNTNADDGTDVAAISHTGFDYVNIMNDAADADIIELDAVDTVTVTDDGWVYYEVDKSGTPSATAKFSTVWPPSPDPQLPMFQVCYVKVATIDSVEQIFTLGQLQFSQVVLDSGGGGGGGGTFLDLTDTPSSYAGEKNKYLNVNAAEDAVIFKTPPLIMFRAVSLPDYAAMVGGHSVVKEDLTEFRALTEPLCGDDPPVTITVSGAGNELVTWGGETWQLPGDSGVDYQICPTNYIENLAQAGGDSTHSWNYQYSVWMDNYKEAQFFPTSVQTGTQLRRRLQMNPLVDASSNGFNSYLDYFHYLTGASASVGNYFGSNGSSYLSTAIPKASPMYATPTDIGTVNVTRRMTDDYFPTWTHNGITYKVERTNPTEWP